MSKEAMKLALEALEKAEDLYMTGLINAPDDLLLSVPKKRTEAITALREALAEQPAQQQEPICKLFGTLPVYDRAAQHKPFTHYRHYDNGLQDWADEKTIPLYRFPPASKPWVGLTDEEKRQLFDREDYQGWLDYINAIEAKLKEKNNGN